MSHLNRVSLLGNLGRDPEVRSTSNGGKIANLSLATTEKWKDKNSGEWQEKTEWHRVVVFGKAAEIVEKYCNKGSQLMVEGKLQTRKWTDKDGAEKYTTEVSVDGINGKIYLLDRKEKSEGGEDRGSRPSRAAAPAANPKKVSDEAPFDDEIPF